MLYGPTFWKEWRHAKMGVLIREMKNCVFQLRKSSCQDMITYTKLDSDFCYFFRETWMGRPRTSGRNWSSNWQRFEKKRQRKGEEKKISRFDRFKQEEKHIKKSTGGQSLEQVCVNLFWTVVDIHRSKWVT